MTKATFKNISKQALFIRTLPEYMLSPGCSLELPVCKVTMDMVTNGLLEMSVATAAGPAQVHMKTFKLGPKKKLRSLDDEWEV